MRKSTNKELVAELEARNENGQYAAIIEKAKSNRYHDFKNPDDVICGKMELIVDLEPYSELADIRGKVMDGEYDESMDEEDKAEMRAHTPKSLWPSLGL